MAAEEAASKSSSSLSPAKKTIVDLRIKVLYGDDHGGERCWSWWCWWSWWMRRARLRRRLRSVIMILLVVFSLFSFYLGHNVINMIHTPPSTNIFMLQTWMNTIPTTKEHMAKNGTEIHAPASVKVIADQYCKDFVPSAPPVDKKRTGPRACDVCYLPFESALASMPTSPSESPVLKNLNYVVEDGPVKHELNGGSSFAGYPSLRQRSEYFNIKESMTVHCGFVKGETPGLNTGFDIDEVDRLEMNKCDGIVVVSTIFGDYDTIKQPEHVNEYSKKGVCFFMFVDENTEAHIRKTNTLDSTRKLGLWRVVVARNLPYDDDRRNGKIPKMLPHRLFPNARWSLWIDGKLRLTKDPILILERYLWRHKYSQAISKHYRRFDVFEEGLANMVAGKYENASIIRQLEFYKNEGLTPYSAAKLPIESDVPEGCVIIREHTPITNLFSCLWFNEVDRFTSRDQLSFAIVRNKINASVGWLPYMFPDCERRNFVIQSYHKDVMKQKSSPTPPVLTIELPRNHSPPPPVPIKDSLIKSPRKRGHVRRHRRDGKSR